MLPDDRFESTLTLAPRSDVHRNRKSRMPHRRLALFVRTGSCTTERMRLRVVLSPPAFHPPGIVPHTQRSRPRSRGPTRTADQQDRVSGRAHRNPPRLRLDSADRRRRSGDRTSHRADRTRFSLPSDLDSFPPRADPDCPDHRRPGNFDPRRTGSRNATRRNRHRSRRGLGPHFRSSRGRRGRRWHRTASRRGSLSLCYNARPPLCRACRPLHNQYRFRSGLGPHSSTDRVCFAPPALHRLTPNRRGPGPRPLGRCHRVRGSPARIQLWIPHRHIRTTRPKRAAEEYEACRQRTRERRPGHLNR